MSDLISRKDVKGIIRRGKIVIDEGILECDNVHEILVYLLNKVEDYVEKAVDELPSAQQWIPCSERLPEVYEDTSSSEVVLVCGYDKECDYSWQAMGFYVKTDAIKRWFFAECKNTDVPIDWIDIVAWMPLPGAYKGE